MGFEDILLRMSQQAGIALTPAQQRSFCCYYELLLAANAKVNLTAVTDPQGMAVKHVIDSLLCYRPEVFDGASLIDVGSGAGFPGVPLKIVYAVSSLILLESQQKKVNFLLSLVQTLALAQVSVVHARAEEAARRPELRERFGVAVARAVAPLNVLAELCLPFVKPGGYCVALKGGNYQAELASAQRAIALLGGTVDLVKNVRLPGLDHERAIVYIKKTGVTPARFPRRPGLPAKRPLG